MGTGVWAKRHRTPVPMTALKKKCIKSVHRVKNYLYICIEEATNRTSL